ncbi:MAG: GAF domain-containing sensor histidine kinase [Chloroflexota bacterium]|nr:GAF domain-containing sensor histidine kinase [Chloroflexota bacterium]
MTTSDLSHLQDVPTLLSQLQQIVASVIDAANAETLGGVLKRIAEVSRELVRAKYAALGVPDGKGNLAFFEISGLAPDEARRIGHPPIGRGLLGAIMLEREPIRLENLGADPRSIGFPAHHPAMTRFLGVPILSGDQLFGMFYLTDREDGQPFSATDQSLIETTAGYAALAIAGARLREQRQRLALLEERERISMDLHDGVIQSLYAVGMMLDLMRVDQHTYPDNLTDAIHSLNAVIEDIRNTIHDLKRRNTQTIHACLDDVIARLHVPASLDIEIDAPPARMPFGASTSEAVCQMAQEIVSNAIRHAGAARVQLAASVSGGYFQLRVVDDGVGFDPAVEHDGLGLHNVRQRAALHRGIIAIESAPGRGTTVILTLPVTSITGSI